MHTTHDVCKTDQVRKAENLQESHPVLLTTLFKQEKKIEIKKINFDVFCVLPTALRGSPGSSHPPITSLVNAEVSQSLQLQ